MSLKQAIFEILISNPYLNEQNKCCNFPTLLFFFFFFLNRLEKVKSTWELCIVIQCIKYNLVS